MSYTYYKGILRRGPGGFDGCSQDVRCRHRDPHGDREPGTRNCPLATCHSPLATRHSQLRLPRLRSDNLSSTKRTVMPLAAPHPMKMESARVILGGSPALGVRPSLGLVRSARKRTWSRPRLDFTSNPTLSPPDPGGARRGNCSTPRGRPTGSDSSHYGATAMDDPSRLLRRARRPQEDRRRLHPPHRPRRRRHLAGPHLRHHDRRPAGPGRLARRRGRPPRRHGIHRRLLEADLQHPGGPLRGHPGQRPAGSSRSPAARPTSRTPSGSRSCSSTACSRPASSRRRRSASSAT